MWTVTTGTVQGVSTSDVNLSLNVVTEAANYWGRYLNFNGATLDIVVNFISLGDETLAQAGTSFTSTGGGIFQAATILELQTGIDPSGAAPDISIDINADVINDFEFFYGLLNNPNVPRFSFDLFTVLLHEIGHGLGFISFFDLPETVVYDTFVSGLPSSPIFTGAAAVAAFGGNVPLDNDPSHVSDSLFDLLMRPGLNSGVRTFLSNVDVAILKDIGLPILAPTNGADILFGFPTNDTISLLGGDDIYDGLDGGDLVFGGGGNDRLYGRLGDDTLNGGIGNDTLIGGASADILDGGADTDIADYANSISAVTVNLATGLGSDGDAFGDTLSNIEDLQGSSFADSLTGDNSINSIFGGAQNDTIAGLGGGDMLEGGAGFDTASYVDASGAVIVNLQLGTGVGDDAEGDVLSGIEAVIGSSFGDSLTGSTQADRIFGANGADTLIGAAGDDTLRGDDGNDQLFTGFGNDRGEGGAGADLIKSGPGRDTLLGGSGDDTLGASNKSDLLRGEGGNDLLLGSNGNDRLFGGDGDDTMLGGNGRDTLQGDAGADRLVGGAQADTASYADAGAGVQVSLLDGSGTMGDATGDQLIDMENLIGSAFKDTLTGDDNDNRIDGKLGADFIQGMGGDDQLIGGDGFNHDTLEGGAGNDAFLFIGRAFSTITDFTAGAGTDDIIRFIGFGVLATSFADIISQSTDDGTNTTIDFGDGAIIVLQGVTVADLHQDDFVFG